MNGQTKFVLDNLLKNNIKEVLNIGYRHDSDKTVQNILESSGIQFSVLEVYGPNCDHMRANNTCKEIFNIDVREIEKMEKSFDAIIWLHGPEHIYWNEFLEVRKKIESKANKLVIYQAPIGEYPQDEIYGNPYERHVEALLPSMFEELEYEVHSHDKNGECTFSAVLRK